MPRYQTFCPHCGARQVGAIRQPKRTNAFGHLKSFVNKAFEGEAEKHYKAGCQLMMFGGREAIPEFEEALSLDPGNSLFKTALATAYLDCGLQQDMDGDYDGAVESFHAAIAIEPDNPHWYSALAHSCKHKADLKSRGWLSPEVFLSLHQEERATLISKDANDIQKLYDDACENYSTALKLDPSDARSHMELSEILREIGKERDATANLEKALAILNKAILADNTDKQSYSERARIFEDLENIDLAIADLERTLTFSTRQSDICLTKLKIEELRKSKQARGK